MDSNDRIVLTKDCRKIKIEVLLKKQFAQNIDFTFITYVLLVKF